MLPLNHPSFSKAEWLFQPLLPPHLSPKAISPNESRLTQSKGRKLVTCWLLPTYSIIFIFNPFIWHVLVVYCVCYVPSTVVACNGNRNKNSRSTKIQRSHCVDCISNLIFKTQRLLWFDQRGGSRWPREVSRTFRQTTKVVFPWHCPLHSLIPELTFSVPQSWLSS